MPTLSRAPLFVYNPTDRSNIVGTDLQLSFPQMPWAPRTAVLGGHDKTATGLPEGYTIRRDRLLDVSLRVRETELTAFETMVDWCQDNSGTSFYYFANSPADTAARIANKNEVYLESPVQGEELVTAREGILFLVNLTIRRVSGRWGGLSYYG